MKEKTELAKFIALDLHLAAHRLSENLIFVRFLDEKQISKRKALGIYPGSVIMTNNKYGERHDPHSSQWNLYFEGKKHYVLSSFSVEEFTLASTEFQKINL
jgi:hypothetical protein